MSFISSLSLYNYLTISSFYLQRVSIINKSSYNTDLFNNNFNLLTRSSVVHKFSYNIDLFNNNFNLLKIVSVIHKFAYTI